MQYQEEKPSDFHLKDFDLKCGDEEGLAEPFVRLLILVRTVNEEDILEKETNVEIEI